MWLLFHRNARTRIINDGESFVETCPECGERAKFREVEVSESFGVFFVDLVGDKERAFRCGACGQVFDLKDRAADPAPARPAAPPAPPPKSAAELQRERAARSVRIEDELAELKKRMGR